MKIILRILEELQCELMRQCGSGDLKLYVEPRAFDCLMRDIYSNPKPGVEYLGGRLRMRSSLGRTIIIHREMERGGRVDRLYRDNELIPDWEGYRVSSSEIESVDFKKELEKL